MQLNLFDELIIDSFAGGGGASTGIELALGRPVDIAINHDKDAIAIGLRMLEPKELYAAQGVPADYIIDFEVDGKKYSKAAQVARCGNMVCPPLAKALVKANLPELCGDNISTMAELNERIAI